MINVSNEFLEMMEERADFCEWAEITLADGTVLSLGKNDFTVNNNFVVDGAGENAFPLGSAVERSIQIELMNDDDHLSAYDYVGARIRLYLTFDLSETTEKIDMGTFTVLTPETYGDTVIITAVDDMYKADEDYESNLNYPATLGAIIRDSCDTTGIRLFSVDFSNNDFIVQNKPNGITHRQLYGYVAMMAGGNARINRSGYLEILSYAFTDEQLIVDGGNTAEYEQENTYDGGDFSTYSAENVLDGGSFEELKGKHVLYKWKNLKVDTDNIVITGIQTTAGENNIELLEGLEGYVLKIDNPLISGQEAAALKLIGARLIGATFRQFEGDHIAYPLAEFMDPVIVVDRKGNVYESVVTDINFAFFGFTTMKNSAESAIRNSSKYYSAATETYKKAKKLVEAEKTAREEAVAALNKTLAESSGLYQTAEEQKDGSIIYYLHDKTTLGESQNVIKLTAEAIGCSNDGGKTYPYGFALTGEMITRVLQTEGINADWINAGAFTVKDQSGNIIFSADMTTKKTTFVGGYFDATGAHFTDGYFSGKVDSAHITGTEIEGSKFSTYRASTFDRGIEMEDGIQTFIAKYSTSYNEAGTISGASMDYLDDWNQESSIVPALLIKAPELMSIEVKGVRAYDVAKCQKSSGTNRNVEAYTRVDSYFVKDVVVRGDFYCGGEKNRTVQTQHFGTRALHAYEMTYPIFGDIGSGIINEAGFCNISIDDIFAETANCNFEYFVFLQKEGEGNLWVSKKENTYFTVMGTSKLSFTWEVKAIQRDYETTGMTEMELKDKLGDTEEELLMIAEQELADYERELEEL